MILQKIFYRIFISSGNENIDEEWNKNNILIFTTIVHLFAGDILNLKDYEGDELNEENYQKEEGLIKAYGTLKFVILQREYSPEMDDVFLYVSPNIEDKKEIGIKGVLLKSNLHKIKTEKPKRELQEFNFSHRCSMLFNANDIVTTEDLVQYSKYDLLKFRGFGKRILKEIEEKLHVYGYSLNK